MARKYRYSWRLVVQEATRDSLQGLAAATGFINDTPGAKFGDPSPASLLDALAERYRLQPTRVVAALIGLGVAGSEVVIKASS